MPDMTIGRAAQAAGVNVETIRFYERRRLIEQPQKPAYGGYRAYPEATVRRVRFIRRAQDLGFSLNDIAELLSLQASADADAADVRDRAMDKLREVDAKIERLRRIRSSLTELLADCPGKGALSCCSIYEALKRDDALPGEGR